MENTKNIQYKNNNSKLDGDWRQNAYEVW